MQYQRDDLLIFIAITLFDRYQPRVDPHEYSFK